LLSAASYDTIRVPSCYDFQRPMPRRKYAWEKLSNEQLLQQRLNRLKIAVEGTSLKDCISTLYDDALFGPSRRKWIAL
jgi:hypothetical protein